MMKKLTKIKLWLAYELVFFLWCLGATFYYGYTMQLQQDSTGVIVYLGLMIMHMFFMVIFFVRFTESFNKLKSYSEEEESQ